MIRRLDLLAPQRGSKGWWDRKDGGGSVCEAGGCTPAAHF